MNRRTDHPSLNIRIDKLRIPATRGIHSQQFVSIFRAELERRLQNSPPQPRGHTHRRSKQANALSPATLRSTTQLARETAREVARQVHASGKLQQLP